ncbi:MAG: serpin family protein, partial [Faecalibacterium sp.]
MKKLCCLCLALLCLTGCTTTKEGLLTAEITRNDIAPVEIVAENSQAEEIMQFSLDVFSAQVEQENLLISPLSITYALAMTANGAQGETLAQMEQAFGTDIASLNEYLYAYQVNLPEGEQYQVNLANSIWLKDSVGLRVQEEFLQTNVDYYDAQVFQTPFDDTLAKQINTWVSQQTDGMIEQMIDDVSDDAVLYLINALSFDAQWETVYQSSAVRTDTFTNYDGTTTQTEMMYGTEYSYFTMENAVGFKKSYEDERYSFVAILPEEGMDIITFVEEELDGELLCAALQNTSTDTVLTAIPKFSVEYEASFVDTLISLGIEDAFDASLADFSKMATSGTGALFIEEVIHKTELVVDEEGTQA